MLGPLGGFNPQNATQNAGQTQRNDQQVYAREQNEGLSKRLKDVKAFKDLAAESDKADTRNPYSPFDTSYNASAKKAPIAVDSGRGSQIDLVV
ncbi:MAG: hypothetical protein CL565_00350 [Alphaproteobacteria bacterium]|nr:hypothetical protein [Alphaproteobacteria bacterium]